MHTADGDDDIVSLDSMLCGDRRTKRRIARCGGVAEAELVDRGA